MRLLRLLQQHCKFKAVALVLQCALEGSGAAWQSWQSSKVRCGKKNSLLLLAVLSAIQAQSGPASGLLLDARCYLQPTQVGLNCTYGGKYVCFWYERHTKRSERQTLDRLV